MISQGYMKKVSVPCIGRQGLHWKAGEPEILDRRFVPGSDLAS